jgi:hypothetical protein
VVGCVVRCLEWIVLFDGREQLPGILTSLPQDAKKPAFLVASASLRKLLMANDLLKSVILISMLVHLLGDGTEQCVVALCGDAAVRILYYVERFVRGFSIDWNNLLGLVSIL